MRTPTCPQCGNTIAANDVNVANDLAFCRACNLSSSLSDLTHGAAPDRDVDLSMPPPGAWYRDNGTEKVIGATGRSIPAALGLLAMAAFWNGVTSLFVLVVLSSTLLHLGVRLPAYFPSPMTQAGQQMSVGMTIFMWLFLTPFILIGLAMLAGVLSYLIGNVEVKLNDTRGAVYNGYGKVGFKKEFQIADVTAVRLDFQRHRSQRHGHDTHSRRIVIELEGGRSIKFGSFLNEPRMNFVFSALNTALGREPRRDRGKQRR